ncbi:hypothetical protein H311_02666 [Anncaliia algerae PRA109]|nr:hypothetical protein H311_02666 [Anncaliia algerae PRA109]
MTDRKQLLIIYDKKESLKLAKEFCYLRNNTRLIEEKISNKDDIINLVRKKKCRLYLSIQKTKKSFDIALGRLYDEDEIDFIQFNLIDYKGVNEFSSIPFETNSAFFTLFQNLTPREENLFIDVFCTAKRVIFAENLKYYLVISKENNIISLRLFRNDQEPVEIGPYFSLETKKSLFCSEEIFNDSLQLVEIKEIKNVRTNGFNDKIGRIYIEQENCKDIKFKRNKAYKEFTKESKEKY